MIEHVMVDIGTPFKWLNEHLENIRTILLTHIHTDHVKESTLKRIVRDYPHIEIFGNYEVVQYFREYPIKVINAGVPFTTRGGHEVTPFKCVHDVLTYGYVWEMNRKRIIYATDTMDLRNAPILSYDYFFIESNHDEKKLEMAMYDDKWGYNVYQGGKRHMSTQKCKGFFYSNRRTQKAKLIELHKSSRFY